MYHYTYIIIDTNHDMFYYGVRSSKVKPLEDTKYMGSSKWLLSRINRLGKDCFIKLIDKEFRTREEANDYETSYMTKNNLAEDESWYNLTNLTANIHQISNKLSSEQCKRRSERLMGKGHHNHKKANIFTINGELVASEVCIREWCRNNPCYDRTRLQRVARYYTYGALSKKKGYKYPERSHKGLYAIYITDEE